LATEQGSKEEECEDDADETVRCEDRFFIVKDNTVKD